MYIVIVGLVMLMVFLAIPFGSVYGSRGDWISQHIVLGEQFRQVFYDTGSLLSDFSWLGAGSNMYQFAYYGLLRPDILISFFLPFISMEWILIAYAIFERILSAWLFYYWIQKQEIEQVYARIGTLIFLFAGCFFHAHRQLMFINYMPWLILGLLMIDRILEKRKPGGFCLAALLVALHSYYYLISCVTVWIVYLIWKSVKLKDTEGWKKFIVSGIFAAGMSAVLLLPTLLSIAEHEKDVKAVELSEIFSLNEQLTSMLYSAYGTGLTILCLYLLLVGLWSKKNRGMCAVLIIMMICNPIIYLLNGGLYVREKIMIPFLPLIVVMVIMNLKDLLEDKQKHRIIAILVCAILAFKITEYTDRILIEMVFCILVFLLIHKRKDYRFYFLLCIPGMLFQMYTDDLEQYVTQQDIDNEVFTVEEIESVVKDTNYRFDLLNDFLNNSNKQLITNQKKTGMYSSTTNTEYNRFFFDYAKHPIKLRNRVAMVPEVNPIFMNLMGVRYIQTTKDKIPLGYKVKKTNGKYVLAENKNVRPLAYGSTTLLDEALWDTLELPEKLLTLDQYIIVREEEDLPVQKEVESKWESMYTEVDLSNVKLKEGDENLVIKKETGSYEINSEEEINYLFSIPKIKKNEILLITFHVENYKEQDVNIKINEMNNKLSSATSNYPNENHEFTYMIANSKEIKELEVKLSAGNYEISNIQMWRLEKQKNMEIQTGEVKAGGNSGCILEAKLTMDEAGYFVTSLPIMNGYKITVNGEEYEPQTVNKSFLGCKLEAGDYTIKVYFKAPGKTVGIIVSLSSLIGFAIWSYRLRQKNKDKITTTKEKMRD